ncbi:hypothetical protein [Solitalea longa]|uniref:hypothetical protein n=1 Tax=Solitalea longa TaxID=2079460 RepID=UPI0013FE30D8|nr:hypothetical protein [Solitalea longa]
MNEVLDLLSNYSKEKHSNTLYQHINPIPYVINPIKSQLWVTFQTLYYNNL